MAPESFSILNEDVVHSRYMTVYNRRVRFNSACGTQARELEYDVVGHPQADFSYAIAFPFHPSRDGQQGGEVTLVREYAQGVNAMAHCLPTGAFDPRKHSSLEDCARAELSEEASLSGGRWVRLLPEGSAGIIEVKWCANRGQPFLVIDPQVDEAPASRDLEEFSIEVVRVTIPELKRLMKSGSMLGPSITACYMALEQLQEEGLL